MRKTIWGRYGYGWITLILFAVSLTGHWLFGWFAFVDEETAQGSTVDGGAYVMQMLRDTLENWQSEFLQLLWQVCGLAIFLFAGSPASKEGGERLERKLDAVLRAIDPQNGAETIRTLDEAYCRRPSLHVAGES